MTTNNSKQLRRQPEQDRAKKNLNAMLDAAATLIGECGADGFSMAELARRAGVSKPALYRYFPNKQAVLLELARASFQENRELLVASLKPDNDDEWQAMRKAMQQYCQLQRSQPYRSHLRAAIQADPERMALDMADPRQNSRFAEDIFTERYPGVDRQALRTRLMLIMSCAETVAHMTTQVSSGEAEQLIEQFIQMCQASLPASRQA